MAKQSRQTKQKAILDALIKQQTEFFTADELFAQTHKKDSSLGIATVYRFLNAQVQAHELYSYICDRKTVYSKNTANHCHFECEKTGQITHFTIDNIDFLKNKIPGTISSISIVVKGVGTQSNNIVQSKQTKKYSHIH